MDGESVCGDECWFTLKPSDEWSLDILSVKNEEKQLGSVILAVVVGRAVRPATKKNTQVYSLP